MTLSLEQEFTIRSFAEQVKLMSHEQSKEYLLILYEQMMVQETAYRQLLKQEWKLNLDTVFEAQK
jgi:Phycobilisome degradation protein nblA